MREREKEGKDVYINSSLVLDVVLCAIFVLFGAMEINRGPPEGSEMIGSGHQQKDHMDLPKILVYSVQVTSRHFRAIFN